VDETERAALARQAVNGDGDALQRLIVHYHGPLYGTVEGRLDKSLRRHIDPDDILQQAYVKAFKSIRECTFDGPGGFYKWLERIALDRLRNAGRDLRAKKRDVRRNLSGSPAGTASYPDLVERLTSAGTSPSGHLARREAAAAVISSLARLTDAQRDVVRMRFLEDRPVAEIAATLGKSEEAVYRLCSRGLDALQKMLGTITRYLGKR
jgi:RNA polymerase sigma-70 factor (subfamily 1)